MRKYGINNFRFDIIEYTDDINEREMYYILHLKTYGHGGYNATIGGDGVRYADYNKIVEMWTSGNSYKDITRLTGYAQQTIERALSTNNILRKDRIDKRRMDISKKVAKIDLATGSVIEIFNSIADADRSCNTKKHISQVCLGSRKSAGGYGWKYI